MAFQGLSIGEVRHSASKRSVPRLRKSAARPNSAHGQTNPHRRRLRTLSQLHRLLRSKQDGYLVDQVSDGLQAVRHAQEHKPDLVLLDIGLPGLNGLAAARQIRELSPDSKILFVTQESSPEVVREAFAVGTLAYVLKSDVEVELFRAIDTVSEGQQYVSARLAPDL